MSRNSSPEAALESLSRILLSNNDDSNYKKLKETADSYKLFYTPFDYQELKEKDLDSKTIRRWFKEEIKLPVSSMKKETCLYSPNGVDVKDLQGWGIPKKEAPELLRQWRSAHKSGEHKVCELFKLLHSDLTEKNRPFKQAKYLLETGLKANEFGLDEAREAAEIARVYWPSESKENQEAAFKELGLEEKEK